MRRKPVLQRDVMRKLGGPAIAEANCRETDATRVAKSVHRDFSDLIVTFERQLCTLPQSESVARSHIDKAKAAAERGLKLSEDLIAAIGH